MTYSGKSTNKESKRNYSGSSLNLGYNNKSSPANYQPKYNPLNNTRKFYVPLPNGSYFPITLDLIKDRKSIYQENNSSLTSLLSTSENIPIIPYNILRNPFEEENKPKCLRCGKTLIRCTCDIRSWLYH